MIHSSIQQSIW